MIKQFDEKQPDYKWISICPKEEEIQMIDLMYSGLELIPQQLKESYDSQYKEYLKSKHERNEAAYPYYAWMLHTLGDIDPLEGL